MDNLAFPQRLLDWGVPLITVYGVRDDGSCRCPKGQSCATAGKHPINNGWTDVTVAARTMADLKASIAAESGRCNFGALTGHRTNDGRFLFVLDVDVDNGKQGAASMEKLAARGIIMPNTLTVRTGGGGLHYYLGSPTPVPNMANVEPGIDIRGLGGFVVIPPSSTAKGIYTS